jgi:hypothetical protein
MLSEILSLTFQPWTAKILIRNCHRLRVEARFLPGEFMVSEIPAMDSDYPEVVNMHETGAASVRADLVRASSSQIKQLSAQEVDLRDSVAVVINAETVNARKTGVAHLEAGNFTLLDGKVLVSKSASANLKGRAGLVITDTAGLENSSAAILVSRQVKADHIRTGLLISRNVEGNVETLMDTRATVLAGVVAGVVLGSILMLGQYLFRRK